MLHVYKGNNSNETNIACLILNYHFHDSPCFNISPWNLDRLNLSLLVMYSKSMILPMIKNIHFLVMVHGYVLLHKGVNLYCVHDFVILKTLNKSFF
jgi:hypothetical protein